MTEPASDIKETARRFDAARQTARREIQRLALDSGAELVTRPAYSMPNAPATRDVESLAGTRAARDLELAVQCMARDYIRQAREAGHSWNQIAQALSLTPSAGDLSATPADAAYDYAAGHPDTETPWRPRSFGWTCRSCDRQISDRGVLQGPADDELGHADGCPGLTAAITAWDTAWEAEREAGQ